MILKFKDIPIDRSKFKKEKDVRFNLNKNGGWDEYRLLAIVNDDKRQLKTFPGDLKKCTTK